MAIGRPDVELIRTRLAHLKTIRICVEFTTYPTWIPITRWYNDCDTVEAQITRLFRGLPCIARARVGIIGCGPASPGWLRFFECSNYRVFGLQRMAFMAERGRALCTRVEQAILNAGRDMGAKQDGAAPVDSKPRYEHWLPVSQARKEAFGRQSIADKWLHCSPLYANSCS